MDDNNKTEGDKSIGTAFIDLTKDQLVCKYCCQKFTILQNLRRHMKSQHLGFRYSCATCSAEVTRREDLVRHYSNFHPEKMEEADNIKEVCKLTEDGKIKPLGRVNVQNKRKRHRLLSKSRYSPRQSKQEYSSDSHGLDVLLNSAESLDSTLEATPLPTGAGLGNAAEPQRVIMALDPVTQFRLERVIAERVNKITERSVIETLDKAGRVTRRETIDREYFLNVV